MICPHAALLIVIAGWLSKIGLGPAFRGWIWEKWQRIRLFLKGDSSAS